MREGEISGGLHTNLAGVPGAVISTSSAESATHDVVRTANWRSGEAEMPSDESVNPSLHDGLYYCQYEGCQRLQGFTLKCQLK